MAGRAQQKAKAVGKKIVIKILMSTGGMTFIAGALVVILLALFLFAVLIDKEADASCGAVAAGTYVPQTTTGPNMSIVDIVYAVGKQRGVSDLGMLAAFETALVESGGGGFVNPASNAVPESLNYPHDYVASGDYDSVGVFQQRVGGGGRDGKPWGTVQQIMDPTYSAGRFFDSLAVVEPRQQWASAGRLAQAIQISAFPSRYDDQESEARTLINLAADRAGQATTVEEGPAAVQGGWVFPVTSDNPRTSSFGPRWGTMHKGQDWGAPIGTPVYAAWHGTVVRSEPNSTGGYGSIIYIDSGNGISSRYAHNSSLLVTQGQNVEAGQQIALSGNTGDSTGPHVHFEILVNGTQVDPFAYLVEKNASEPDGSVVPGLGGEASCSGVDGSLVDPGVGPQGDNGLTPRAENVRALTVSKWGCDNISSPCVPGTGGYDPNHGASTSDHRTGNAVDITVGAIGSFPNPTDKAMGQEIADFFVANAGAVGVKYIIWNGLYWGGEGSTWTSYTGGGFYDPTSPTGGHFDHVHVSVYS